MFPKTVISLAAAVFLTVSLSLAGELPEYILQMGASGKSHAILVDKKAQTLYLYKAGDNGPELVKQYRCTTGKNNNGTKIMEGDKKTPNGIYFFRGRLDGAKLPEKYGAMAFTMDYPNDYDRRDNKTGYGIWMHSVDDDSRVYVSYDTEGCVVVTNDDIRDLSRYIALRDTPIIIDDSLFTAPQDLIETERQELASLVERWRASWSGKDIDAYMDCYHEEFTGKLGMDKKAWREYKSRLNRQYRTIEVNISDLRIWRYHDYVVAMFIQEYRSSGLQSRGLKLLYILKDGDGWRIYSEKM